MVLLNYDGKPFLSSIFVAASGGGWILLDYLLDAIVLLMRLHRC